MSFSALLVKALRKTTFRYHRFSLQLNWLFTFTLLLALTTL